MLKKICLILALSLSIICCDKGETQYNDYFVGTWNLNNNTEYITFTADDVFMMNDSIQGSYEVGDENDNEIFYYYISKSGYTEGYGYMVVLKREKKSALVVDLPLHEGDTIKIFRK